MLYPKTTKKRANIKHADIAISRPDYRRQYPDKLVMVHIDNGEAKISTTRTVERIPTDWKYEYTIAENVINVAIEYNGYWVKFGNKRKLITVGEPWVFWVDVNGILHTKRLYSTEEPLILSDDIPITQIYAMRGWKSTRDIWKDQGLIVAYIKEDKIKYRSLCEQVDGSVIWESERVIEDFPININSVSLFRANDYRTGILAECDGQVYMALTERNWSGLALEDHHLSVDLKDFTIELFDVVYHTGIHEEHITLDANLNIYFYNLMPLEAYNPDDKSVEILFNMPLSNPNGQKSYFAVQDSALRVFNIGFLEYGETENIIRINMNELFGLNEAQGDLTVMYNNGGITVPSGLHLDNFSITFTPIGLEPPFTEPPNAINAFNVEVV